MSAVSIPLSQGYVALVDEADADRVLKHKWSAFLMGSTVYAQRCIKRSDGMWTTLYLHQFLTAYTETDHRNGDGLDNRRENLRPATRSQNLCNRRCRIGASGFRGVTWQKNRGAWKAQIGLEGKNYYLGYFPTAEEAARARDIAARDMHGEFAVLNFPALGERGTKE